MKYILRSLLFALMVFISQLSFAQKKFVHPERVRYDGSCMTIEGKDVFVYSAAFHYFRCPEELWKDRFRQIKEAGFNTVETYVPWNWHERTMPLSLDDTTHFDFSDLKRWLNTVFIRLFVRGLLFVPNIREAVIRVGWPSIVRKV